MPNDNLTTSEIRRTSIDHVFILIEKLSGDVTRSLGFAVCHTERAIERAGHGQENVRMARALCNRGTEELRVLVNVTNNLRQFVKATLEAAESAPDGRCA